MLVHGFAEDSNVWKYQLDFLKDKYQLIVPDLPGSGLSPVNSQLSTIDNYAEGLKAIPDHEGIARCTMLGHSMGGYITLAFAEKYPEALDAFGLIHSSAYADNAEKIATRKKAIEFIHANGAFAFLKTSIPGLFSEDWTKSHQPAIDGLIEAGKDFTQEALVQYYNAMISRPDRTEVLKAFAGPVLFTMGIHDKAVPFDDSMEQSHLPEQSQLCILRLSAHMGMWEETAKTNQAILGFLDQSL